MKEFPDNSLKFDDNGQKFSKRGENTVGKGEIAPDKQFLLFWQGFQKMLQNYTEAQICKNKGLFRKVLNLYHTIMTFNDPVSEAFWKHCENKEKMLITSIIFFSHNLFYPSQSKF